MSESTTIARNQEVQQLEILYELSMSIGDSLDMRRMLKSSLSVFLRKLNCVAGGVYHINEKQDDVELGNHKLFEEIHTIPRRTSRNAAYQEAMAQMTAMLADDTLADCAAQMPIVKQAESGSYYHLFELPKFGILLLVKNKRPIDPLFVKSLRPLLRKLATAASACLLDEYKEVTLQHNETMLSGIVNNTTAVIYVKKTDGSYMLINRQYEKLFHISNEEIQGKTDYDLFPADMADEFRDNDLRVLEERKTVTSEEVVRHDDGLHTYTSVRFPLFDISGEPYAIAGVSTDITTVVEQAEAQRRQLAAAVEQSLDGTAIADLEGNVQFANPAWAEMHGYEVDEIIGQPLSIFHTEEQLANEVALFNQYVEELGSYQGEVGHKRKDGTTFPTWMTTVMLRNDDGIPTALVAAAQDITERKEAELLLKREQEKTKLLLDTISIPLLVARVSDGTVVYANQPLGEVIRMSYTDLIDRQTPDFYFDPADREILLEEFGRQGYLENYELRLKRSDGEPFWGEVSIRHFTYQGESVLLTALLDISARRQASAELEISEKRYRTLFDAAADAIELVDAQGILVDCNDVYLKALGYERDEVIGQHVTKFFTAEGAGLFKKIYPKLKEEGYIEAETDLVRKNGSIINIWRKARAIYDDDGEMTGIVVYNRDITERQRIEAAIEAHSANLQAVADVSTAISAILEIQPLLQVVSDTVKEHFGYYHAHIFLMSDDGESMLLMAGAGEAGKILVAEHHRIALDHPHSVVAESVRTKSGLIVNDVRTRPDYMTNPYLPETQAEMAIPIIFDDHVMGVLDVQSDKIDYFSREDRNIQMTLASQIAVALQNAEQYRETQEALAETEALLGITKTASGTLDLDIVLDEVLTQVLAITGFESGLFSIVNAETNSLDLQAHRLPEEWAVTLGANGGLDGTLCDLVYRDNRPIVLGNLAEDTPIDVTGVLAQGFKAYQGVPMQAHEDVLGTLCLFGTEVLKGRDADIEWLAAVGSQIGFAIQNARLFEQSEAAVAELDVLTRRLTREGWDSYLDTQEQEMSFVYGSGAVTGEVEATAYDHPLHVYGEKIGNLALYSHDDEEWDDETAEIITAVTAQLTARIENLRLTDETQRALSSTEAQAKRLTAINQVAQAVSQESDMEKMLEATYNQVRNIMPVDSFFVGIYDKDAETLSIPVMFENEFVERSLILPVTPRTKSYQVIHTGEPLVHFLSQAELAIETEQSEGSLGDISQQHTASQIFIPLQSGLTLLGVFSVQAYAQNAYTDSDVELVQGVASYVAVALENIRLFSETEERAEQLATINRVAQTISRQLDMEQMLEAVHEQLVNVLSTDSFFISLYDAENDTVEYPLVFEGEHRSTLPTGVVPKGSQTRKVLDTGQPILLHTTREEAEIDKEKMLRDGTGLGDPDQENSRSLIYVPMQSGTNTIGVLSVQSYQADIYTPSDVRLVSGIAQYLTVALENVRLFTDTQMRAAQLEKLSEIEGALSQAKSESEVIQALALFIGDEQAITLHYVEESENETPMYAYTVAHWENGECHPDDPYLMKPFLIEQHADTNIGLRYPNQVTFIADIEQDDRMDVAVTAEAHDIDYGAVVIVPMRSAGRWQGFISLKWQQAHKFTDDELFLWNRLREPAAAVVAGRRAFMAQQGTLRETEALYEAGEKLNAAATYNDVLDVMREYTLVGSGAKNVSLNYFSEAWLEDAMPEEVYVLARRTAVSTEGDFQYTAPSYRLKDFPSAHQVLKQERPILIEEVATDPRFDENARALYMDAFGAVSTIFVPLVAGGQWFGYINAIYHQVTEFPEVDVRRLMALAGQAAVSIQSIHLLEATTKRAEREQTLRQITERVRGSASVETVLQTAVQELSRALGRRAFIQLTPDKADEA